MPDAMKPAVAPRFKQAAQRSWPNLFAALQPPFKRV